MRHYPPKPTAPPTHNGRSPYRNRQAQRRFRALLMARAGGVCEYPHCTATTDLQAHHVKPGYDASCGKLLCLKHHRATDNYAR